MNKQIGRLFFWLAVMFGVMMTWVGYWQGLRAPALNRDPRNPRVTERLMSPARGGLFDREGESLAVTVSDQEGTRRVYTVPTSLGPTVGYVHPRLGLAGLESGLDEALQGRDVMTTLDVNLQRRIDSLMPGRRGAIAVIDATSGEILALGSFPGYDPARLDSNWGELVGNDASPLFNRPVQGTYPPGSSFKPLVMAAALQTGAVTPQTMFDDAGEIVVDGYRLQNFDGHVFGRISLQEALTFSSNVAFARIGLAAGGHSLQKLASDLGFGRSPDLPLPATAGQVPDPTSDIEVVELSIGQGTLTVTPLQMAVLAATVGNGGWRVTPHIVGAVRGKNGKLTIPRAPLPDRVLRPEVAGRVGTAMRTVVTEGTGKRAEVSAVTVAGKTGTAENPHGRPHAWFVGYAPAEQASIAFAVVVENGGTGGTVAAPIAAELVRAYFTGDVKR